MKWLLQNNIWNEYGYHKFEESIVSEGIDHEFVHLIPFTENFTKEIDFIPTHIFGSGRFVNVCRKLGYPTYKSFDPIETFYPKELWINGEGEDIKWGDLPNYDYTIPKFVKPYTEKFFTGRLIESVRDLDKIQLASSFIGDDDAELVRISDAVNIQHEVRFYVIGGQVITGSYYIANGQVSHLACPCYEQPHIVCGEIVLEYGNIDEAFVMDLGKVGDEWKIVELNNLNSSGLYECDTTAIVRAFKQLDK